MRIKSVTRGTMLGVCLVLLIDSSSLIQASNQTENQVTQDSSIEDGITGILKIIFDKILNRPAIDTSDMDCRNRTRTKDINGGHIQTNGTTCIGKGNNSEVVFESMSSSYQASSEDGANQNQTKKESPSPTTG